MCDLPETEMTFARSKFNKTMRVRKRRALVVKQKVGRRDWRHARAFIADMKLRPSAYTEPKVTQSPDENTDSPGDTGGTP